MATLDFQGFFLFFFFKYLCVSLVEMGCKLCTWSQHCCGKACYHKASTIREKILTKQSRILADSTTDFPSAKKNAHANMGEIKALFLVTTAKQPHNICLHHSLACSRTDNEMHRNMGQKWPSWSPGSVPENLPLTTFSKKLHRIQSIPSVCIYPKSCKTPPSCNKCTACEVGVVSPVFR